MADNQELVKQFIAVTGVNEERARFYLESSAGQLEVALGSFFEDNDLNDSVEPMPTNNADEEVTASSSIPEIPKPKAKVKNNSKFATIHTINNSSSEDEEEGQAFYAGGSEHSGQQVLGPRREDIVSNMFKAVREHGVEILEATTSTSKAFKGTGYRLGQTSTDSETVAGAAEPSRPEQVTLKLWRDGFSLNDGEIREYSNPANRQFLETVLRGEIPSELRENNSEVHLAMEDHRTETYDKKTDRKLTKAFTGQGHTLGSPTPVAVGAPAVQEQDSVANEARARNNLVVDPAQPVTNIQIRLADGSRLIAQFNHGHTLGEVRSYITTARPQYETRPFSLLTTYPSRSLKDSETLAEAGLLNAAIMQKLI